MKKLLAIALGLSLFGATLSAAGAQGTGGSPGKHVHGTKNNVHGTQYHHDRGGKKHHPGHKKPKK